MSHCERQHLQRLLDESLPETAERDVAEHVAHCPTCQAELEDMAAGRVWWKEASQRLSRSSFESAPAPSTSEGNTPDAAGLPTELEQNRRRTTANSTCDSDSDHFDYDFAVDFLEPSDDPTKLGRLGDCEIVEVIGRGGMGIVLKGFQQQLNRFVAVKVLAPHLATSGAARRRFAREAQATAAIVHPHVMAIHSVHATAKLPYLVMPFVACESLQERLDRQGPLDLKDVLRIGMQAALGLAAAHAQGLVHRDVKPANILLETTVDRVMLTDFGLARAVDDATLTRTGVIAGTPQYMSPEQANGDAVDARSDLFSLGSVLYAMCAGRPPFRAETTFGVLRRIREATPRPIREINSDIPEWLDRIVKTLLSKEAARRIDTASTIATLLERCLAHVQQPTSIPLPAEINHWSPGPIPTSVSRFRSKRAWAGALVVATAVVALVTVVFGPRPIKSHNAESSTSYTLPVSTPAEPVAEDLTDPRLQWDAFQSELQTAETEFKPIEAEARRSLDSLIRDIEESDLIQQREEQ
ncbi:MAG: serine/threonine protein kinase [Planctomycetes bacterium]|nr:serine/threonine protein kinase [Planctomycetota bacterium]